MLNAFIAGVVTAIVDHDTRYCRDRRQFDDNTRGTVGITGMPLLDEDVGRKLRGAGTCSTAFRPMASLI